MEKIFKKSLALVLSAALCLTALVGCLTVSAEGTAAKPTYALDAVKGKPGDTVIVTATLSNLNKVTAQHIKVTFPAGLEIGNITDGNGGVYTRLTETTDVDDPNLVGLYSKTTTADNGTLIQFVDFVNWPNADGTYTNVVESLVVKFAVTISTEAVAGHVYDITAAVDAADYDADKLMDVALTPGKITVTTATVCEHEWKFVSAVPATGSDNSANTETSKGSITLQCSKCDVEKTEPVNYNYYARSSTVGLNLESETIMRFGARYEKDFSRITTGANITKGYIVLDQSRNGNPVNNIVTSFADCDNAVDATGNKVYNAKIGLIAVAMSDDVSSNVYAYDETTKAWYNGITITSSIASSGLGIISKNTTGDLQKTMIVNLLNYGAAAQIFKNVNTENLANAAIDSYQEYAKQADDIVADISVTDPKVDEKLFFFNKFQLLMEAKIMCAASFRLTTSYTGADKSTPIDMSNYTVEVKYTNLKGTPVVLEIPATEFSDEGRVNRFTVQVPFDAADLRAEVSYSVKLNGKAVGPESICSIEALIKDILASSTNENQINTLKLMMAYSDAAKAYLSNK